MNMSQYVSFALKSETTSAAEISALLGVQPDECSVRGSERSDPPCPAAHSWELVCRQPGLHLDEQAEQVLSRLAPVAEKVRALTETGEVTAALQFVRHFDDDEAAPAPTVELSVGEGQYEMGPEPGYLLGWHLSSSSVRLLATMRASIDADEYGG